MEGSKRNPLAVSRLGGGACVYLRTGRLEALCATRDQPQPLKMASGVFCDCGMLSYSCWDNKVLIEG